MDKLDFLFEIGTEDIPAGYIQNAVEKLYESFVNDMRDYRLDYEEIFSYSTPRRIAIKILGIDSCQSDETIEKSGPAKKNAFDNDGNLTKAGLGFLSGANANAEDLYILSAPKGEYIALKIFVKGKTTREMLPMFMKNGIENISFPKSMKWGEGSFSYARPIRWIVGLIQESIVGIEREGKVLDFEFHGLRAGNISYGNRFEKLVNTIEIESVHDYPEILTNVKVIADRDKRKKTILKQLHSLSKDDFIISIDERLLDTVVDLVEWPTAVVAKFSERFLSLPQKIITSTLSQNQKYFTITNKDNCLINEFVFISNGDPGCSDIIKIGNEKVVEARLEDAQFYFQEDTKKKLEEYVPKLAEVVFHGKLGTLFDKTERIVKLCEYLYTQISFNKHLLLLDDLIRAAHLCKADLVTMMLGEKEFTKLQGYVGMNYSILSGEKDSVSRAIYDHYMPRGQNDDLPSEIIGAILAIADKFDTICGIFGVGLIPTGSNDPFALRRACNGVVQIIDKYDIDISISLLVEKTFCLLNDKITDVGKSENLVKSFLKQRIKWLIEDIHKVDTDVIDSLDIFDWENVTEIRNRAIDLQTFKKEKKFEILVGGYKRVSNILDKTKAEDNFDEKLLKEESEIALYEKFIILRKEIEPLLDKMLYKEIMEKIVLIGEDIDRYFDNVLIMCEDISLRNNRLALLTKIRELFLKVADLSKIVYNC